MPTTPAATKSAPQQPNEPFSLVPRAVQRELYAAIYKAQRLRASRGNAAEHAINDVAEIAATKALRDSDIVLAPESSIGVSLVRGESQSAQASEVGLFSRGFKIFSDYKPGALEQATAAAVAHLSADSKVAALISCGALTKESGWRNAIRFAAHHRLPILYLVRTQLPVPVGGTDFRTVQAEYGIPVITVDFSDAIAVYRVTTEALHNARFHRGASILEAVEITRARESHDALQTLEAYMRRRQAWNEEWRASLDD